MHQLWPEFRRHVRLARGVLHDLSQTTTWRACGGQEKIHFRLSAGIVSKSRDTIFLYVASRLTFRSFALSFCSHLRIALRLQHQERCEEREIFLPAYVNETSRLQNL